MIRRPRSLFAPTDFLSREGCQALFDTIVGMTRGGGETTVSLVSRAKGSAKWARNRIVLSAERYTTDLYVSRRIEGAPGVARTTRLDEAGLREAVQLAEEATWFRFEGEEEKFATTTLDAPMLHPALWSQETYDVSAATRSDLAQRLIAPAETARLMSAGTLSIVADGTAYMNADGIFRYYPTTSVECSVTVRDAQGTQSGWAGVNHYDIAKIDPQAVAARALDKAIQSAKPQAVEPGRYTVILEPQATADLVNVLMRCIGRGTNEAGYGPFSAGRGRARFDEQVFDRRVTLRSDPMDPDGGFIPFERQTGAPFQAVTWIDRGILRELSYDRSYAVKVLGSDIPLPNPRSYRLVAAPGVPTVTVEEMIANTERGILVTRLHGVELVDSSSLLCTGYTRDGLWLIERGRVTRAIKNFRFTESPLFVLNKVLDIGQATRVFTSGFACLAPAIRAEDFSFTSLAGAV